MDNDYLIESRRIRAEQDVAFSESLVIDRAKVLILVVIILEEKNLSCFCHFTFKVEDVNAKMVSSV